MPGPAAPPESVDTTRLSLVVSALANKQRLDILRQLVQPKNVSEIKVFREEADPKGGAARMVPLTRQAILSHIEKLEEVNLVGTRVAQKEGAHTKEYFLREDHLFMVLEEIRALGNLAMTAPTEGLPDRTLVRKAEPAKTEGPDALAHLVLIRGIREGRVFPLHSKDPSQWWVGRERKVGDEEVDVPLEYDLFISRKHAVVKYDDKRWTLRDAESLNGTTVNWSKLLRGGEEVELKNGDVIGVGRSLLLFRAT